MPGPLPRWLTGCIHPFLPLSRRPSPKSNGSAYPRESAQRLQSGEVLRGCSHSLIFRPPSLLPPRSFPPLISFRMSGRPWRLHPSRARFVASPRIGYASRPNRAIDGRGLPPPRSAALLAAPTPLSFVLAFPIERDVTNSRAPSLRGRYSASSLLRTRPPPSRLRSISRLSRLYDLPCSGDFSSGARRASPVTRCVLVTVLSLSPRRGGDAASVRFRHPMLPSPYGSGLGPRI